MIPTSDIPAVTALHDAFDLTAKEALVLLLLSRRSVVESHQIRDIYCDHPERTSPIEARSAVKRIRRKVGKAIRIQSVYGVGYELEEDSRKRVRDVASIATRIAQALEGER
jgi:DNA-binding response OmpR family regulator